MNGARSVVLAAMRGARTAALAARLEVVSWSLISTRIGWDNVPEAAHVKSASGLERRSRAAFDGVRAGLPSSDSSSRPEVTFLALRAAGSAGSRLG